MSPRSAAVDAGSHRPYARSVREVASGVFAIDGLKTGRSYLVEDDNGLALVDTSSAGAAERIVAAITEIGHRPEDLRTIVATHYHHDHTGNVASLIDRSGARLHVHADDVPYVDGRTPWMQPKAPFLSRLAPKQYALKVDEIVRDGQLLAVAGGLQVVHTPGHTPGHIALRAPDRGVLFAGDCLMNILGLRLLPSMSSHDMAAARESVRRLAGLEFDVALPGHGAPIVGRASEKIAEWARKWL